MQVCATEVHEAIKAGPVAAYRDLAFVEAVDMCGDGVDVFEVRNCACGSTLYRPCTVEVANALNTQHAQAIAARREASAAWKKILVDAGCL